MSTGVWVSYNREYDWKDELPPISTMTPEQRDVLYVETWDKDGCHLSDGTIVNREWLKDQYFQPSEDFMKYRLIPMLLKMIKTKEK